MESEKTLAQKEIVETLTKKLNDLENYRVYLTKFVMDEKNADNPSFQRASKVLTLLRGHLIIKRDELQAADAIWLELQLDDLEAQICQPVV